MPVYAVPVLDRRLVYSPLHGAVALVNRAALEELRTGLHGASAGPAMTDLLATFGEAPEPLPELPVGPVRQPLFLGLVPTRGCNMACRYCGFLDAPGVGSMSFETARCAIDAYLDLIEDEGLGRADVHLFGGEPLHAPEVVEFVVGHARLAAAARGVVLHIEVSTNGLFPPSRARWLGDWVDSVVLSLDGPPAVQNGNRPTVGGDGTYDVVFRTASILSECAAELVVRSCVTDASLPRLVEWATRIARDLRPDVVCFERLTPSERSDAAGLRAPDPWEFARSFIHAARVLREHGIMAVTSTTDLRETRLSCCPVGRDALIVTPDGIVNACYLLEERWREAGLDLRLGRLGAVDGALHLNDRAVADVRTLAASRAPRCERCLCRLHCAGGCHVDHRPASRDDGYDDLCVSTRLITVAQLLERLARDDLAASWLADPEALAATALQPTDLLEGSLP